MFRAEAIFLPIFAEFYSIIAKSNDIYLSCVVHFVIIERIE